MSRLVGGGSSVEAPPRAFNEHYYIFPPLGKFSQHFFFIFKFLGCWQCSY